MPEPPDAGTDAQGDRPDEAIAAQSAERQRLLLAQLARWLEESPGREGVADYVGHLLEVFAEGLLADLMAIAAADRLPAGEIPSWVRFHFDTALGGFGMALRASIPDARRHQAAQILQLRMLEAERQLLNSLENWSKP